MTTRPHTMKRNARLAIILLAALSLAGGIGHGQTNVIFVVADDTTMRTEPHGHPEARTPNLNRLAAKGVTFRRTYCQFPFCGPSRSSYMTGMYPWRIGISSSSLTAGPSQLFPNHPMIPQYFARFGYSTVGINKVNHLGRSAPWQTYINRQRPELTNGPPVIDINFPNPKNGAGTRVITWDLPDERFSDGIIARDAVGHLRRLAQEGGPFFLGVAFAMPHTPWYLPHDVWTSFDPDAITLPEEPPESYSSWWNWPFYHDPDLGMPDTASRRGALAGHDAAMHFMDRQLGKILDVVDEENLWSNTVIVFFGDHGFSLGEHRYFWSKLNPTNECLQVPMIIAAPGGAQGRECWTTTQLVDLYQTLIDLCGLPAWDGRIPLDGRSLGPAIADPGSLPEAPAFSVVVTSNQAVESPRRGQSRVVHYEGWKMLDQARSSGEIYARVLYDHNTDPGEYYNLPNPERRAQLEALFPPELDFQYKQYHGYDLLEGNAIPDRDGDGLGDEIELALASLGLNYLEAQPELADLLAEFAPAFMQSTAGTTTSGRGFLRTRLLESSDLENWAPSKREPVFRRGGVVEWPDPLERGDASFFRFGLEYVPPVPAP